MLYLRARWYDAGSGTFTSRDPFAGFAERPYSLHPYQYGYSNPARYIDPSGQCATGAVIDSAACVIGGSFASAVALPFVAGAGVILEVNYFFIAPNAASHRRDLARGAVVAYRYPVESAAVLMDLSTPEEVFGPPHTGHTEVLPLTPRPEQTSFDVCLEQLPGTTFQIPSWRDFVTVHPLPEQQTVTVWMAGVNPTDYPLGTGFSGVYNRGTQNYLLYPSSNTRTDKMINEGWVLQNGGHIEVQNRLHDKGLASDPYQDVGFAVIYESANKFKVTYKSNGVNLPSFFAPYPPLEVQEEVAEVIKQSFPHINIEPELHEEPW